MNNISKTNTIDNLFKKELSDLYTEKTQLQGDENLCKSILNNLSDSEIHPRCDSIIPLTNLLYVEATLHNTEYLVRYNDHKCIASQKQVSNYIENIIEEIYKKQKLYDVQIDQIEERLKYINEFGNDKAEITQTEQGHTATIYNHSGFVDIVEFDSKPYKKERIPKFKTTEERDAYLKSSRELKTK